MQAKLHHAGALPRCSMAHASHSCPAMRNRVIAQATDGPDSVSRQWVDEQLREAQAPELRSPSKQERQEAGQELVDLLDLLDEIPDQAFGQLRANDPPAFVLAWARKQKAKLGPGKLQAQLTPPQRRRGASPNSDLRVWMMRHTVPAAPTPEELDAFIESMELPATIKDILIANIYPVPGDGLFTCDAALLPGGVACPRTDVVDALVQAARSQPRAFVACVGGRRRTGKSFSNPWAQVTAISVLEGQEDRPAPRSRFICYLPCQYYSLQPAVAELTLLLIALAYLGIPALFDEFSRWAGLPPAIENFLYRERSHPLHPPLPVRPLHFLMQDSDQSHVQYVLGGQGVLYGRSNLGVVPLVGMPQPSIHLMAGMLTAYHPNMYPSSLLRMVSTHGRALAQIALQPELPAIVVATCKLTDMTALRGDHLKVLERVLEAGEAAYSQFKQDWGTIEKLEVAGYLERSCQPDKKSVLNDPALITRKHLQATFTSNSGKQLPGPSADAVSQRLKAAESQLAKADGQVLEVLARQDLVGDICNALGMSGKGLYSMWSGALASAEFDLLFWFDNGPVVHVSCKRAESQQSQAAFIPHIKNLQTFVTNEFTNRCKQPNALAEDGVEILRALTVPGSELIMVGLSAVPSEGHHVDVPGDIEVSCDGQLSRVPCRYVPLLLEQLVKPVPAEPVAQVASLKDLRDLRAEVVQDGV